MNHLVENRNNQRFTGGQKTVLVQVQILPIKEHRVSALNSKQGIPFQMPWSAALNRFGLEMGQGTHHSQWINIESREKQWLHSLNGNLLTHLLSSLIIYLNCYSFFITTIDINYYHKMILNSTAFPQNIYTSSFQRLFEKFSSFLPHQPPTPKYRGWLDRR